MYAIGIRRAGLILATCAALLVGGGGANAAPAVTVSDAVVQEHKNAGAGPASDVVVRAVDEAFEGETGKLETLLNGPHSAAVQQELRSRLESRGDFQKGDGALESIAGPDLSHEAGAGLDLTPMSTGQYDNYCTGYNGVTMGWYGKEILACHGYLDSYISGRHVAHYNPDLIPRGYPVSVGCAYAGAGAIMALLSPVGTIGWAAYGVGVLFAGGGIVISCG